MKNFNISIILAALVLVFVGCKDEDLAPIITFDSAGKGAYPRLLSEGDKLMNLFDLGGSQYTYSIEFVDLEKGATVAEYKIEMTYEDNNDENGDNSIGPIELKKFSSSDFKTNGDGFVGIENITITSAELLAAAGISAESLSPGDDFEIAGTVTTTDGAVFKGSNSSTTVNGAAFRGHFDFTLPAGCPSDLTGTFPVKGSSFAFPASQCDISSEEFTGEVEIVALGAGKYAFSDWSFGGYSFCYGNNANSTTLTFTEVCAEVTFTGFVDAFDDTWEFVSSIDGNDWTIEYKNTFGESGIGVITNPNGWSFTLK